MQMAAFGLVAVLGIAGALVATLYWRSTRRTVRLSDGYGPSLG